jgi:hypothetical protein
MKDWQSIAHIKWECMMPGVPVDNILAMYEAYYENAGY